MSSVNNDEVRKLREYYQKREEELKAQQAKELKKLKEAQKAHQEKSDAAQNEVHNKALSENKASITRSDMRHNNDIEKLKSIHAKQLRDQAERAASEEKVLKDSFRNSTEQTQKAHDRESKDYQDRASRAAADQRARTEQLMDSYNRRHNETMMAQKNTLSRAHEEREKENLERQQQQLSKTLSAHTEFKDNKKREIARLKNQHVEEQDQLRERYQRLISQKESENNDVVEDMREFHQDGVNRERRQYMKALEKEREALMNAREDMKKNSGEKKIAELNDRIAKLDRQSLREKQKAERAKKREIENMRISYEDSLENIRNQKSEIQKAHAAEKNKFIAEMRAKADEDVRLSQEEFKNKVSEQEERHALHVTRMERRLSRHNAQKQALQDQYFKQMRAENAQAQVDLHRKQQQSLGLLKNEHEDALLQERKGNVQQTKTMKDSYEAQMSRLQARQNAELDRMKQQYDATLAQMRKEFEDQAYDSSQKARQANLEREKGRDNELKAKEAQFEHRLKKMEEAYNESLKRMNKQHDENVRMITDSERKGKGRYA